jgi:hypothetical protein
VVNFIVGVDGDEVLLSLSIGGAADEVLLV